MSQLASEQAGSSNEPTLQVLLICHHDAPLDHEAMASWLNSFGDLVGIVRITERPMRIKNRIKREIMRVGRFRSLFDVLPFRLDNRVLIFGRYIFGRYIFVRYIFVRYNGCRGMSADAAAALISKAPYPSK